MVYQAAMIFVLIILAFMVLLILINKILEKFLKGDYHSKDYEIDDNEDTKLLITTDEMTSADTDHVIADGIHPEHSIVSSLTHADQKSFKNSRSRAKLHVNLEYSTERKVIIGSILKIDEISTLDLNPDEICFHVKIIPQSRKCRVKTKWKDADERILAFTFLLGPLKFDILPKSIICMRLYGRKKQCTSRCWCVGEALVPFSEITDSGNSGKFIKRVLPKSSLIIDKGIGVILSSDSENES